MTDFYNGWAPVGRIRRPVALPEDLDHKVTVLARAEELTPSAYLGQLLDDAFSGEFDPPAGDPFEHHVDPGAKVQRIVALDRAVYSALSEYVSDHELAFSDVATAIVCDAVESHVDNGNGNGNGSGH